MSDFIDLVDVNPISFVKQIVDNIPRGYYVKNTMAGFPIMGFPFTIRMFEMEAPAVIKQIDPEQDRVYVEGYAIMEWLLEVQDVVIQGFEMDMLNASVDNYKGIWLKRKEKVSFAGIEVPAAEEAPKPKATKRQTKSKQL
ncbi:hypothetical protein vBPFY1MI_37 [Pseudomonas phage vB_PF_Y1-MI]|nr:hypothetical protein vBPFY1MI_37 [Pseudomonas phage vB_PF_Y1-MI]